MGGYRGAGNTGMYGYTNSTVPKQKSFKNNIFRWNANGQLDIIFTRCRTLGYGNGVFITRTVGKKRMAKNIKRLGMLLSRSHKRP